MLSVLQWLVFESMGSLPLKSESQNGTALQDYIRKVGVPNEIRSDNSETGSTWTKVSRDQCIMNTTTEPKHPWQNPDEPQIGALNSMVKRVMKQFKVPL